MAEMSRVGGRAALSTGYSGRSNRANDYRLAPPAPDTMIFDAERPHRFVDPVDELIELTPISVSTVSITSAITSTAPCCLFMS